MGPTRMVLSKPVIAAVEGFAVAGGLELAVWCDLRVAASDAVFGVYCRRWGVPLIDGGTIRLPRLIGQSHALDLILTGRGVSGDEAVRMGLVNRSDAPRRRARRRRSTLAQQVASFPQICMRGDRRAATGSGTSICTPRWRRRHASGSPRSAAARRRPVPPASPPAPAATARPA